MSLHVIKLLHRHIVARVDNNDVSLGQHIGVIINMVGQMANLSSRNDVKSYLLGVGGALEDRI